MSITHKSKWKKDYKSFVVYKITNPKGQIYIGATTNLQRRIRVYSGDPRVFKNQTNLHQSILKHGWNHHKVEILYEWNGPFSITDIKTIEQDFILNEYIKNPEMSLNGIVKGWSIWRNKNI